MIFVSQKAKQILLQSVGYILILVPFVIGLYCLFNMPQFFVQNNLFHASTFAYGAVVLARYMLLLFLLISSSAFGYYLLRCGKGV